MKQEFECHDEYVLRLKLHGPEDFEDARLIKELFIDYTQHICVASNVHEVTHYLHELHDVDRWLPMCLFFKEECYQRERELKLDLEFLQSYKIDPEYLRELFSRVPMK